MMSLLAFPQVVPVLGSPMMMVEPGAGVSMMSRLGFPQVVSDDGLPRPIVEPGVVEMRSGWEMGLVGCGRCGCCGVGEKRRGDGGGGGAEDMESVEGEGEMRERHEGVIRR